MGTDQGSTGIGVLVADLNTASCSRPNLQKMSSRHRVPESGSKRSQASRRKQDHAKDESAPCLSDSNLFEAEIAAFLTDRRARGLSERTIEFYHDELRYLTAFLQARGVRDVAAFGADDLRAYLVQLAGHRNAGGVHAAYRAIRAFLRWYEEEMEPEEWKNPVARVRVPRSTVAPLAPLSTDDLASMLGTCQRRSFAGDRDRAILLALLDTGCRAAEFVALNLGDIDLKSGSITVRKGKGGKSRTVFLGNESRRELLRYLRHRPEATAESPLWVTRRGQRLTYAGLRQMVCRRARRGQVSVPSLHSFRRAFALLSLRSGMNVFSLQRLMGHSDLSALRRYLAQTQEDLQKAHEGAGPVDHLRRGLK